MVMRRIMFFIDGFNVYHALQATPKYWKYKWLDYTKLAQCYITSKDTIIDIYYFSALATWNPQKVQRHKALLKALRLSGVKIVLGEFKLKDKKCRLCNGVYQTYEEKQTDVNIAIKLFQEGIMDNYDRAIIISGDSDLIPALEAVKKAFPAKEMGIVIPTGRKAESLKATADFYMKMKEKHLSSSQFDDVIPLGDGKNIQRPSTWV